MRVWWTMVAVLAACGPMEPDRGDTDTDVLVVEDATVAFETTLGTIVLSLDGGAAPNTVTNLLTYVDDGFYDGTDGEGATIFHRVDPGFVIQGGGFTADMRPKLTRDPVAHEGDVGLSNLRGTVGMARTSVRDSATSQWYVNLANNGTLDPAAGVDGYVVFGEVSEGMDVVDAIAGVQTGNEAGFSNVPEDDIVILSVERL